MNSRQSTSLLASFATIKALSDENKYKSAYQILAEFIRHIIVQESIHSFNAADMKSKLKAFFDFSIPEAVVKTTAKKMAGISLSNGLYYVDMTDLGLDSLFTEKKKEADECNSSIISSLIEYVQNRMDKPVNSEELTQDLIALLMDEQRKTKGKYTELISQFIISNEHNTEVQGVLNRIREGSILYFGLNHNISETGSITEPLALYLATEVLFSLVGYNGEIYKQLALEFFNQVKMANAGVKKKINLYYFNEVKREIDDFFFAARDIVEGRKNPNLNRPAMISITNGCNTSADVAVKQADFFHNLTTYYGITEDPHNNYYDEIHFETNIESFDYIDEADKAKKKENGIKYISHINKLREGKRFSNELESKYLLVTNTRATLMISREQTDIIKADEGLDYLSDFAVSLERITSLLWFKLGNGFGNRNYPANINAVLTARMILSASVAKKAEKAYFDTKEQYKSGIITEEQLAARIITLKKKPMLPEELHGDDIDDIMDFSPDYLSRFETQINSDREALKEKEKIIEALRKEKDSASCAKDATIEEQAAEIAKRDKAISEKDETIATQLESIRQRDIENEQLRRERDKHKRLVDAIEEKKKHRKNILLFIWSILWKLAVLASVSLIVVGICKKLKPEYSTAIGIIAGILGAFPLIRSVLKKDLEKILPSKSTRPNRKVE